MLRGTILHELLCILPFWWRVWQVPVRQLKPRKVPYGSRRAQYLHFFEPEKAVRGELIVYFHGGGWQWGRASGFRANAKVFLDQGYHVAIINHRKTPLYWAPHLREDALLGLRMAQQHFKGLGFSEEQCILGGTSSGGNLAAILFFGADFPIEIKALFLNGAPTDLDKMPMSPLLWLYIRRRGTPTYRQANPVALLDQRPDIPILLLHAEQDGLVPLRVMQSFQEALEKLQPQDLEVQVLAGASHLDAAGWSYQDNAARKVLVAWLAGVARP